MLVLLLLLLTLFIIIIIIKRRSGINPIPPTVKDREYKKKQKQRKILTINYYLMNY